MVPVLFCNVLTAYRLRAVVQSVAHVGIVHARARGAAAATLLEWELLRTARDARVVGEVQLRSLWARLNALREAA